MTTTAYDLTAAPPCPTFDVIVCAPGNLALIEKVTALLDTGADFSMIPKGMASKLKLPLAGRTVAIGWEGVLKRVDLWRALIVTPAGRFHVNAAEGEKALLGLDVLNQLDLRFDGPALQLSF